MSENPTPTPAAAAPAPDSSTVVKRYAPPNQRNRSINRRKSGGFDRSNNAYGGNDGDKNQHSVSSNVMNESPRTTTTTTTTTTSRRLIPLEGCSRSEAAQFLNNRWAAAMQRYNDTSLDLSERPVMYNGSGASAWTQFRLPHQIVPPQNNVGPTSGSQLDFLAELRRQLHNAPASSDN